MLAVMLLLLSACSRTTAPKPTMAQYFAPSKRIPVETTAEPTQPETAAPDRNGRWTRERRIPAAALAGLSMAISRWLGELHGDCGAKYLERVRRRVGVQADLETQYNLPLRDRGTDRRGTRKRLRRLQRIRGRPHTRGRLCESGHSMDNDPRRLPHGRPADSSPTVHGGSDPESHPGSASGRGWRHPADSQVGMRGTFLRGILYCTLA